MPVPEVVTNYQDLVEKIYRIGAKEILKREREAKSISAVSEYIQLAQILEEHITARPKQHLPH